MLAWKIALRYLFSKKSHGVVNVISIISLVGVAVATMAIIIVLSIFNGFTDLAARHLSNLDPQIKVSRDRGKTIANGDSLASVIALLPFVDTAIPVVEERGLVMRENQQMPVFFKGVPKGYDSFCRIDSILVEGEYIESTEEIPTMHIGAGVAMNTGARAAYNTDLMLYVPRRVGRINPANPAASFSGEQMMVTGVFQVGQGEYDFDHVYIDIDVARRLLQYTTEATAIELKLAEGTKDEAAAQELKIALGPDYKVETRFMQQEEAFRMIEIEKWVTFLMLGFILIIASFNIISTLSLLVIEKRDNMTTMRALGAPKSLIRRIFIIQGWLISVCGGVIGIVLGTLLSLAQQCFGFIKLSGDPQHLTIDTYPVQVNPWDLLIVLTLVVLVGLLTSQVTRLFSEK